MPEPPATLSPADRDALVLRLQRDDARDPATLAALAAVAPDDALAVLERARFPQYMARVVASQPTRLRDALYRRAELGASGSDTPVLLAGLLALHRAAGTTLEPRFDPWLADALRTWWADDVHAIWRDALLALPAARREALVCPPADGPIAWRYLPDAQPSSAALDRAVRAAAQLTSAQPDPPARSTPPVHGLAGVGDAAVPHLVAALGADRASTPVGRRVLTAALAWSTSRAGVDALRALVRDDADADVRRLARDGLAARGLAPPPPVATASAPAAVAALHAQVTDALRRAMHACARTVDAATRNGRMTWRDAWRGIALPTDDPRLAGLALADLWHDALRAPPGAARDFPPGVLVAGLRHALAEPDASRAPECLAEIACRVPLLPAPVIALDDLLRDLPAQLERDVAQALGQRLTPDDCGNPVGLYDWLAAHHAGPAPAFARGLAARGVDPRVTRICQRALATASGNAPPAATLQELVDAFAPVAAGCRFGGFELFAVDRANHRSANVDPSGRAHDDSAAIALALQRLADAPSTSIVDTAARFLTSLGAAGLRMPDRAATPDDDPVRERTCDAALQRLAELIVSDGLDTTRSDALANATRFFACLGEGAACVEVQDVADVAFSVGLVAQDRAARFAVLIAYVNEQ